MKSGHEYQLTEEQKSKVLELTTLYEKPPPVFSYQGQLFEGDPIEVAKRFVALNPSDSFWVWLHKNVPMLQKLDTK